MFVTPSTVLSAIAALSLVAGLAGATAEPPTDNSASSHFTRSGGPLVTGIDVQKACEQQYHLGPDKIVASAIGLETCDCWRCIIFIDRIRRDAKGVDMDKYCADNVDPRARAGCDPDNAYNWKCYLL